MAGGSALLKKRPLVLGAVALVLALALAALLVTKPWAGAKTRDDVAAPAGGDRVLQSVDVTMQGDGSLTRVGDTVVVARASGGQADSYSTTYDPTKVVDQLPVRILTSYQTDKGSGTDLDDLKGYSGRVAINLSVQNLTVRPQEITYDSAGRSRTATAQVGAPLTVVASAALPGIDPATVVTAALDATTAAGEDTGSTNGVLSRSQDGTTQVQWASILAPPQLSPTATFRVVLDAKDLVVPTLDVSVQPGLVTDPSVGALIDSAFNPKNSSELALETRTIKLIGDVNDVLGRASGTISGVRKTLDASSKTLGTKTVQSLTEDTKTISTSLKTSSDNIDALGDDLKGSLTTTQSATLQRMSETVSGLQDLIGDTSAPAPSVSTTGEGCATTVKASGGDGGVYGNLLGVTAQLEAYASLTQECKEELTASISASVGSVDEATGATPCTSDSAVCLLLDAQQRLMGAVEGVNKAVEQAKNVNGELDASDPASAASQLHDLAQTLAPLADALSHQKATSSGGQSLQGGVDVTDLDDLEQSLAAVSKQSDKAVEPLDDLSSRLDVITQRASANAAEIGSPGVAGSIAEQNATLAAALCSLRSDNTPSGTLPPAQVESLRASLVDTQCAGLPEQDIANRPVHGSMADRLNKQREEWRDLASESSEDSPLATSIRTARDDVRKLRSLISGTRTELDSTSSRVTRIDESLSEVLVKVNEARQSADDDAKAVSSLSDQFVEVTERYDSAQEKLGKALNAASLASQQLSAPDLTQQIQQVAEQGQASSKQLSDAFQSSSAGLAAAADALRNGSARTLKQQRELVEEQARVKDDVSDRTKASLSQVSSGIASATRDIDSTRTTLTADLNNVLLDLGNPDQPGKGLLGTLGKSARAADSADYQLGLASDTVSSYSSVRSQEVDGILLRQAQAEAALQRQAELPAFATEVPSNVQHRTIYLFHLGGER